MRTGPSSSADKTPFIADQGMRLLREQRQPKQFVGSSAFAEERKGSDERGGVSPAEQGGDWKQISRNQVAGDTNANVSLRRTVIVNDAGLGKSTTAEWLRYEYSRSTSDILAFVIEISELKRLAEIELHAQQPMVVVDGQPERTPTIHDLFIERLLLDKFSLTDEPKRTEEKEAAPVSPLPSVGPLRRLIEAGRVVLIFDALDQAPDIAVAVLGRLLKGNCWATCRIVLTSRPYALDEHWKALFEREDDAPDWRFVRLDEFTELQQRAYLSDERFELIPKDAHEILTVPRVLFYLRNLSVAELAGVKTASDVYSRATNEMIKRGLDAVDAFTLDPKQVRRLLSMIAFYMVADGANFDALSGDGAVDELQSAIGTFCFAYASRNLTDPAMRLAKAREFNEVWVTQHLNALAAMNDIIDCGLLEKGCPNHFQFRNRSLQEFFVAKFLSSYCTESALPQIESMLYWESSEDSRSYRNVWRMFVEMPILPHDTESWLTAASVLFRPGTGRPDTTRRSTEMIYRSWPGMLRLGGFLKGGMTIEAATIEAQKAAFRVMGYPDLLGRKSELKEEPEQETVCWKPDDEANPARRMTMEFLTEYPGILAGRRGVAEKTVAWKFEQGFRLCPKGYDREADGETRKRMLNFEYVRKDYISWGKDLVCNWNLPSALFMHQDVVKEPYYSLFDPEYTRYYRGDDATIGINYYDAWSLALWSGGRLPSGNEWEFCCRAAATEWKGPIVGKVHHWDYRKEPVYEPELNAWGLRNTQSCTWGWCRDWYHDRPSHPSYRGYYPFDFLPGFCQQAFRRYDGPLPRGAIGLGVRVSRIASE